MFPTLLTIPLICAVGFLYLSVTADRETKKRAFTFIALLSVLTEALILFYIHFGG